MYFSRNDRMILESYKTIVTGLAEYLGENSEVVLHSLENLDSSAIMIAGENTGRKIGAPITDLALNMLKQINNSKQKEHLTYFTKNKNGEKMKSTTIAIYGEEERIIGLICINLNLEASFSSFIKDFIYPSKNEIINTESKLSHSVETFSNDTNHLIETVVEKIKIEVARDEKINLSNKNKIIVKRLYEEGVFKIKDSVIRTAELLNISKNTVYLHLRNIEK